MMRTSVPLSNRWVAKLCRSVCTVTRLASPAARAGRAAGGVQHLDSIGFDHHRGRETTSSLGRARRE